MIICTFENGGQAKLRHVVTHAIVEKDGALLMVKRAGDVLETGKWGLPAGFLERDETAAQGILRELHEETGWTGEVISLFRVNSKPDRPKEDRQNVSLDFLIRPVAKTGEPDHESSKVEWIPIDKLLPLSEFAFDHGESIGYYLSYRKKSFPLPIVD
jgi:ADP-ribose pyrophosphatase YjhB (NUDIX family)